MFQKFVNFSRYIFSDVPRGKSYLLEVSKHILKSSKYFIWVAISESISRIFYQHI